jgi:hypothetical protein
LGIHLLKHLSPKVDLLKGHTRERDKGWFVESGKPHLLPCSAPGRHRKFCGLSNQPTPLASADSQGFYESHKKIQVAKREGQVLGPRKIANPKAEPGDPGLPP